MANQSYKIEPTFGIGERIQKYNGLEHSVEIYLDNSGSLEMTNRFQLNPSAIVRLELEDNLMDWVVKGSMTFVYLFDVDANPTPVAGQTQSTPTAGAIENGNTLKAYSFRGDGFDLLRIAIVPRTKSDNGQEDEFKIDETDSRWIFSYVFSITDIEDINDAPNLQGQGGSVMRCFKVYFEDVRSFILRNTNIEYSTALSPGALQLPGYANKGTLPTGTAIAEIFNAALTKPETGGHPDFKIAIDKDWDLGAGQIFYTSPAQFTAEEDIDYVFANHVSSAKLTSGAYDLSVLHTARPKTINNIEPIGLIPLTSLFKQALGEAIGGGEQPGVLQYEHFFVTSTTNDSNALHPMKAPLGTKMDSKVDIKTAKFGQIKTYSFVDMSPEVNASMFRTTPVHSVDIGQRKFITEFKNNNVKDVRQTLVDDYIKRLYINKTNDPMTLFTGTLHKSKALSNIFPTFTLNGDNKTLRQKNGLHQLLYTGLFQNNCITFTTLGLTFRSAGTFIGIDKASGVSDSEYNNRLYGQWFVVKVDHVFEGGEYNNRIYAVKPFKHSAVQAPFEQTL